MSFTRYCDGLRQPCPQPHNCAMDCHFNTAELPEPGAEVEPVWQDIGEIVSGAAMAVLLVIACLLTAVVLVGYML